MLTLATTLAAFNFSVDNLIRALIVLVIAILLFVALWRLIAPHLGEFANIVMVVAIIVVALLVLQIFGVV